MTHPDHHPGWGPGRGWEETNIGAALRMGDCPLERRDGFRVGWRVPEGAIGRGGSLRPAGRYWNGTVAVEGG